MKKKILIIVKTYPSISKKYNELVCTAGITEEGNWIRIYPIPFRQLKDRYKKYQWIETDVEKSTSDPRPESYKVLDPSKIKLLNLVDTKNNWRERKQILKKVKVYDDLKKIIELAHNNKHSLCVFKPKRICDFEIKEVDRNWNQEKIKELKSKNNQGDLFKITSDVFKIVNKLPYKFSYSFEDIKGVKSTLMIEDWEIGELYWNCLKRNKNDESLTIKQIKEKYFDNFVANKDLYLFLGTTKTHHRMKARNPFVIIGVFYPPLEKQDSLF